MVPHKEDTDLQVSNCRQCMQPLAEAHGLLASALSACLQTVRDWERRVRRFF